MPLQQKLVKWFRRLRRALASSPICQWHVCTQICYCATGSGRNACTPPCKYKGFELPVLDQLSQSNTSGFAQLAFQIVLVGHSQELGQLQFSQSIPGSFEDPRHLHPGFWTNGAVVLSSMEGLAAAVVIPRNFIYKRNDCIYIYIAMYSQWSLGPPERFWSGCWGWQEFAWPSKMVIKKTCCIFK